MQEPLTQHTNTPCIKVCKLYEGICIGCFRTLEQIATWSHLTPREQLEIMSELSLQTKIVNTTKEKEFRQALQATKQPQ